MEKQDLFVLAVALLAAVLAIASGWLRYDNANDEEETSEFWYDTGVVLGVLYMITIVVIYFAQTSHEALQAYQESGGQGLGDYAQRRWASRGNVETTAPQHPVALPSARGAAAWPNQTIGDVTTFGRSFAARHIS